MTDLRVSIGLAEAKARYLANGCHICQGEHQTTVRFSRIGGLYRGICSECHHKNPRKKVLETLQFCYKPIGGAL